MLFKLCILFCLISTGVTVDIRYPDLGYSYSDDSKNDDMESVTAILDYHRPTQ